MKKIFFSLTILLIINFFCSIWLPSVKADEAKIFIGTIESIRPAMGRPPKWYSSMFTAVAENGERQDFWILGLTGSSPTSVVDFDGKPMDKPGYNHKPHVNKKAEIKYSVAPNGHNEVILMRYVPADYVSQSTATSQPNLAAQAAAQNKNTVIGKVKDIVGIAPGLVNNWTYSKIVVLADDGNESVFFINTNTSLMDEEGVKNPPLPKKDQKVEVKYLLGKDGRNEAISVRYVPMDYAQEQTSSSPAIGSVTTANASGEKIFIGKIESSPPTFSIPPKRKIVLVSDNGDRITVFVSREIAIRDMKAYPTRIGERAEVKYSIAANGDNEAISFRYVPSDYVQQPPAPTASSPTPAETTAGQGNVFTGRIEKITPTISHGNLTAPRCRILVTADNGEQSEFFVSWVCPFMDAAGKDLHQGVNAPFILKKGQRIEIKYSIITNGNSITNGQRGADSIRCLD